MTNEEIRLLIDKVKESVGAAYPAAVSMPAETTAFDNLTNFLRDTPARKVFLIHHTGGDYEYDESMNIDAEIAMDIENDELFSRALSIAEPVLGKFLGEYPALEINIAETNYEDTSKEGERVDDIDWTPEYEGGAIFRNADSYDLRYWIMNNSFICLQKGKWSGDGNFLLFVLMTVSPVR